MTLRRTLHPYPSRIPSGTRRSPATLRVPPSEEDAATLLLSPEKRSWRQSSRRWRRRPWDGPKQGEPFSPCRPLLHRWAEGGRRVPTCSGGICRCLVGRPGGVNPQLAPVACQQQSSFRLFDQITCHPKAPVNQCPLAWIHPGFGDGATVHHPPGKAAPAEPGRPCSVPVPLEPTSPSRKKPGNSA